MQKKPRKTKKSTKSVKPVEISHPNQQEALIHDLENAVAEFCQDLPLTQTFGNINDSKQMAKMIAALSGTLDSLHIEDLTAGLFPNPKEDAMFAKNLSSVLHGLKNLSTLVQDNISESVE